ncbi:nucleotide exchange factor GrpE [Sphingomonas bacterium]|uniref:nucleotide exchange factor GrpE n=1 Tax=Sphingomonas bacterium TaxID=1895847 RepID=UPI0015768239|nr:nucleotide exchange factor GrpE [Sphingomonas bacterium]
MTDTSQDLREETAEGAPELAEHDGHAARLADLEEQLAATRQEVLYAQAETQNVRRRAEKEAVDARAYAATSFARDVLSVSDNLERALASIPAELRGDDKFKGLVAGLDATGRELAAIFTRNGIARVVSIGEMLDPNKHQAMMEMPSDQPPGTIVQEMQPGYTIKDRLLRPALVAVARAG